MSRADAVGENEREPAGGSFVDDDRPRLALRQEREHIGGHVHLDDALPLPIACEGESHSANAGEILEPLPLRALPGQNEQKSRIVGLRHRVDEDIETLFRRQPGNREHDHVVRLRPELLPEVVPPAREPVGLLPELLDVDRVREHAHPLGTARRGRPSSVARAFR